MNVRKATAPMLPIILSLVIAIAPFLPSFGGPGVLVRIKNLLPAPGDKKILQRQTIFATSPEAYSALAFAIRTHDTNQTNEIARSEEITVLPKGTVVFGLWDRTGFYGETLMPYRILSGPHAHQVWFADSSEEISRTTTYLETDATGKDIPITKAEYDKELADRAKQAADRAAKDSAAAEARHKIYEESVIALPGDKFAMSLDALRNHCYLLCFPGSSALVCPTGEQDASTGAKSYKVLDGAYAGQILWSDSPSLR